MRTYLSVMTVLAFNEAAVQAQLIFPSTYELAKHQAQEDKYQMEHHEELNNHLGLGADYDDMSNVHDARTHLS